MSPSPASRGAVRGYGARGAIRNLGLALAALLGLAGPASAELRLLAFGDSLTAGYGLPEDRGFVPQLQAWLAAHGATDVTVVNGGVSGDTSAGGLARIGWALGDDVDGVIVELGANDMLRGLPVDALRANLGAILAEIDRHHLPALVAGVPVPANYGEDYRRSFEAVFREAAAAHDAIYVPSFLAGMTEGRNLEDAVRLMQPDGLHPAAAGVAANVAAIGPAVLDLLARARARP